MVRGRRWWPVGVVAWVVLTLILSGCTAPPYDLRRVAGALAHPPLDERSVARPIAGGLEQELTTGLVALGFACVHARSNTDATQLYCRLSSGDPTDPVLEQVHLVLDTGGAPELEFVRIDRDAARPDPSRLAELVEQSAARVSEPAGDLRGWLLEEHRRALEAIDAGRTYEPRREGLGPDDRYRLLDDGTVVYDRGVRQSPDFVAWPHGSDHYARPMSGVHPDLLAGGFTCAYPPEQTCTRVESNQQFAVELYGDQVVSAGFRIGTGVVDGRQQVSWTELGFPRGLTVLTEPVRAAVQQRLDRGRLECRPFAEVVAGTWVVMAGEPAPAAGCFQSYDVTLGVPLVPA